MIPSEKDRLECLRLAVGLFQPRASAMKTDDLASAVVKAAEEFHAFVSKEKD